MSAETGSGLDLVWVGLLAGALGLGGCEPYRVEYRPRPAFFASAMGDEAPPDSVVADDGTVIVYKRREPEGALQRASRGDAGEPFKIREELEDGTIVLRALLPEHVLANTMTCLRFEEYELLWDQLLSERTKAAYAQEGQDVEAFAAFFRRRRHDLAATVNRMLHGLPRHEVVVDALGGGVTRLRFHPTTGALFKFRTVLLVSEGGGLRLLGIE